MRVAWFWEDQGRRAGWPGSRSSLLQPRVLHGRPQPGQILLVVRMRQISGFFMRNLRVRTYSAPLQVGQSCIYGPRVRGRSRCSWR